MSGGRFGYVESQIQWQIIEEIKLELERQGKERETYNKYDIDYYERYPEERYYPTYSPEVQKVMKDAIFYLERAYVYAHRLDWFLSGDDSEESLYERLKDDLEKLE